ncbi:uncharacterized protein PAC_02406 [Phialocephala subalpina]|uniref:Cytochrome b561 domain-containing protein n=1 Tax=Phialocephala subalpina TaxID=576137 RepID=A0A1L7WID8_9HELO|nr:uncharacterized protein PAC_02406 [Phialocephala subalpina]
MSRFNSVFIVLTALSFTPTLLLAEQIAEDSSGELVYNDPVKIFYRKRNAHACMMSVVFLVLYPLGAIALHLPLPSFLRKIRIVTSVHVPLQILGLAMMIAAMGLGIDIANDLHMFSMGTIPAHVVIGLLATCMIIIIQPAMGILQHLHFRKTGGKSVFAYIHRWNGRVAIILGMINQGLGFKLVGIGSVVHAHSLIRNFVILGVFGGIWFVLVMWDWLRGGLMKSKSIAEIEEEKQEVAERPPLMG